eukprot:scaffold7166_cov148-Skeletonema_menzelii.AAC.2
MGHQKLSFAILQALHVIRTLDVVLVAIPNRASSGQLCGCSAVAETNALHAIRMLHVVLVAIPNRPHQ